jgi:hypothetical protein
MISHVSNSSMGIVTTTATCNKACALTRDVDSQCADLTSTIRSFDQPLPSIWHLPRLPEDLSS